MKKIIILMMIAFSIICSANTDVLFMAGWGYSGYQGWEEDKYDVSKTRIRYTIPTMGYETIYKSIPDQAKDIYYMNINSTPKILIGHSQGGLRALAYAKDYGIKNNVKAVFTIGSPISGANIVSNLSKIQNYTKRLADGAYSATETFGKERDQFKSFESKMRLMGKEYKEAIEGKTGTQDMAPESDFLTKYTGAPGKKIYIVIEKMPASKYNSSMGKVIKVDYSSYGGEPGLTVERVYTQYVATGEKALPENIRVGAIQGGYNNAYNGVLAEKMAFKIDGGFAFALLGMSDLKAVRQYMNTVAVTNKTKALGYEVTGIFSKKQRRKRDRHYELKRMAESMAGLLSEGDLNNMWSDIVGSKEHDCLIPVESQKIPARADGTPRTGGTWIDGDYKDGVTKSNHYDPDALHGSEYAIESKKQDGEQVKKEIFAKLMDWTKKLQSEGVIEK
jgi:hypothetical protein